MRGTIEFGGKPVELVALAFIMAKQAEKPLSELINSLKYEDYLAWVEDFEAMDIISKVTDVFALYQGQAMQTSVSKKNQ